MQTCLTKVIRQSEPARESTADLNEKSYNLFDPRVDDSAYYRGIRPTTSSEKASNTISMQVDLPTVLLK